MARTSPLIACFKAVLAVLVTFHLGLLDLLGLASNLTRQR